MRCGRCGGTKKVMGLGMVQGKCPICKGKGELEDKKKEASSKKVAKK